MEKEQEREWAEAQKIAVSVDLVEAAKKQLEFLAVVDRNRCLYEGPALHRAIYRYNAFWLPLLAKHSENPVSKDPLVVPLDCEWVWHCHRLNPVRYKLDCEKLFGRILDNTNVISSIGATSKIKTEEMWNSMYPEEPFELDLNRPFSEDVLQKNLESEKFTSYDLVSAVTRQAPFTYQISRPHMSNDLFLREAVARYKGFLHLIRTNQKNNIRRFCVPTYDVDLMWHSHQLNPASYCKDMTELLGKVLQHDDTDSDRTEGKKLHTGFSETTKQFEETFGLRYWKAGAMYRGTAPSPVTHIPIPFTYENKKFDATCENLIQLPEVNAVEVLLEFVKIKNLPEGHKGNLVVSFSKKQPDKLFNTKRTLSILSESGEKEVAYFQCEPTGEFMFELISRSSLNIPIPKSSKSLGSCSLSVQEILASASQLSVNNWLSIIPLSGTASSEPILLHVSVSFTIPKPATQTFHLVRSKPFFKSSCFFPHAKSWTRVVDDDGNDLINLQMRDSSMDNKEGTPDLLKEVVYITDSGETHNLAEYVGNEWSVKGTRGSFKLRSNFGNDGHLFELVGHKMVKLFAGRRLDYEPHHCQKQRNEQDFVTAVEFSADYPYGRAAALIDFKTGTLKVKEEWMLLPGMTLAFILSDILRREGYTGLTKGGKIKDVGSENTETIIELGEAEEETKGFSQRQSGGNCGSGCGNAVNNGGGRCKSVVAESGGSCLSVAAESGGACGGGGKCGGGKCGGGGGCKSMADGNNGGGYCLSISVETESGGACGGGGKCGGGKCGGGGGCKSMADGGADCGSCCAGGRCGGGGCSGLLKSGGCSGKCGGGGGCKSMADRVAGCGGECVDAAAFGDDNTAASDFPKVEPSARNEPLAVAVV